MRSSVVAFVLIAGAAVSVHAAEALPDWVKEAAARPVPDFSSKVSSVVLFQEEAVTVDPDGRRVMRERGAIKVLQPGSDKIEAYRSYDTKSGRIRDFQGWLIPPSGKPVPYAKDRILDVAVSREYVYDEARAKVLDCGNAAPGSVFAWEVTEEEKTVFTQYGYTFQERLPVLVSRFSLSLPTAWEMKASVFNRDKMDPKISGNTYTWELHDLPRIETEEYSPSLSALAPRLMVSYFPPADNAAGLRGLKDWPGVSAWLSPLVDPAADVTDAVRAKAAQLTANAATELDKIRAIAAFTQKVNYVEVLLNVTRGGGYTPHRSEETLSRNFGDCKDKATLMRALLKAAGIESYLTTITADDRTYVRPEWASPMQFNHAIVAIRVSGAVAGATVIEESPLGRLLIFDPTDPLTPVFDLPQDEQGSYALVIAGTRGALLRMPVLSASARRIESSVEATLDPKGKLEARVQRQYAGQSGIFLRELERLRGNAEVKKRFETAFSRRVPAATLSRVTTQTHADANELSVDLDLAADRFGQVMQGRLLVVRPGLLASGGEYSFVSKQRTAPIELEADLRHDSIRIKLPAGFKLDEFPAPAKIESPYGSLEASWKVENGEIVMEETLEVRQSVVPASEYAKVRDFFQEVAGAHGASVVLVAE
jgi:hypothetical protein